MSEKDEPSLTRGDVQGLQPQMAESVVLFDGDCNLCNRSVQFIIRRDPRRAYQFAALQSCAAQRLLRDAVNTPQRLPNSVVLVERAKVYTRSTAALRIARRLASPWPLAAIFLAVPRPLRDGVYDLIAHNRYRLFGRRQACLVSGSEMQGRFLTE